ncbi:MAG TPA: SLBB domain-containing protein, partial [Thermoanaerobaculia bacterium]|nr:SLBB domain-containing protein [Thermoanaerobaculia bacterium]
NQSYPLTVGEDGFITIPDGGGRVYTNGVSLKEFRGMVLRSLSQAYSTYINAQDPAQSTAFVDVKLGKLRRLFVFVVGEVRKQGALSVSPGAATVLNLLNNAGGVKETGSLRQVRIRRSSGTVETVDLYDFLLNGKLDTKSIQVRVGDYVMVPLKAKSVTVRGEVKRAGVYEAIGREGLKDLVRFAGGLGSNALLTRVQVRRYEVNAGERIIDLNLEEIYEGKRADFVLEDGDQVTIFPNVLVRRRLVEILGEGVRRPGIYELTPGMRLDDLVQKAEGLKEGVYLDRVDFIRMNDDLSRTLTQLSFRDLYTEFPPGQYRRSGPDEKNPELRGMDIVQTYSSYEMKGRDKKVYLEGRVKEPGVYVIADNATLYDVLFARGGFQDEEFRRRTYLPLAHIFRKKSGETAEMLIPFSLEKLLEGDARENRTLQSDDRIVIYSFEELASRSTVSIEGLVKKPGSFRFADRMTVQDLILAAGGLTPDAYKVEAVIARSGRGGDAGNGEEAGGEEKLQEKTIVVPIDATVGLQTGEKKTRLEPFDKVTIRNLADWEPLPVVAVTGEALYPGNYTLTSREERLASVVSRAGGFKPDALPEGAVLYRKRNVIDESPAAAAAAAAAPVSINLVEAMRRPGGEHDLILKDGDRLYIPTNPGIVEVRGAVRRPTVLQYQEGAGIRYYVELCGGYLEDADRGRAVVLEPNGTAARVKSVVGFRVSPSVLPGSVIEVPRRPRPEPASEEGSE